MSYQLSGKKYRDMSEEYRNSTSKEDFKTARREENKRMAGDALDPDVIDLGARETGPNGEAGVEAIAEGAKEERTAPIVDNLSDYDTAAFGAGSGRGTTRLSRADLKALKNQGFSKQDIIDYSASVVGDPTEGVLQGQKARNLLDKWKNQIANQTPDEPPVEPEVPPVTGDPQDPTTPPPKVDPPKVIDDPKWPWDPPSPPIPPEDPGTNVYDPSKNENSGINQNVSQSIWQSVQNNNYVDNSSHMENNSTNTITGNNSYINNSQSHNVGDTTINNVTDLYAENKNKQEVNIFR